jgi:small GTP-binding protein
MPKHKGTEKLQADLKKRISKLKEEKEKKSKTKSTYNPYLIDKEGAGQVILLGYPNVGKSSIVESLSNAKVKVAKYPFATSLPTAGMINFEDIQIQLIDTPPLVPEDVPGPMVSAIFHADYLAVVIDISAKDCLDQLSGIIDFLENKRLIREDIPENLKAYHLNDILVIVNKIDLEGVDENLDIIKELYPELEILNVSAKNNLNIEKIPEILFKKLKIIRNIFSDSEILSGKNLINFGYYQYNSFTFKEKNRISFDFSPSAEVFFDYENGNTQIKTKKNIFININLSINIIS